MLLTKPSSDDDSGFRHGFGAAIYIYTYTHTIYANILLQFENFKLQTQTLLLKIFAKKKKKKLKFFTIFILNLRRCYLFKKFFKHESDMNLVWNGSLRIFHLSIQNYSSDEIFNIYYIALYGHRPPITKSIQVRWTRHAGHCWRSRDELISDVHLWTPTYGWAKAGRPARTYIQQLCEDTGYSPEDLPEAMNDREKWRERVRDIRASDTTWWWWRSPEND